ncbi:MAG TPA: c-type cytochrome [Candidatus Sulfotelmatobacter sp.]|nr:c-type cytochrome [Candidatus Sulfotelmatobacter sp.]
MDISALPEPGRVESTVTTRAKDWYIRRAARHSMSMPLQSSAAMISTGETLFGMGCANCHGQDGRKPTPIGQSMYPRVLDLSSPAVQRMSDQELFWVIKNGIRLSGMPGFGRIQSDEQIWQLTYYVRSLDHRTPP